MLIGIVGKPNCGKSTFFAASTLVDVEIGNRPFVTIKPNQGTGYVTRECVHIEKGTECQPMNSKCEKGTRLIPMTLLDVAGLVPDAWQGKGLGNQFMNDLMQAKALIHVIDASGSTDAEGNEVEKGSHDPAEDIRFLEKEINYWIKGILDRNWEKITKKADADHKNSEALFAQLSGLGISEEEIIEVLNKGEFAERITDWGDENILDFCEGVRKISKPLLIAANKIDVNGAKEKYEKLLQEFPDYIIVPCCAEAELALRKASRAGAVNYIPGEKDFEFAQELNEQQKKALEFIREKVIKEFNGTGVQDAVNKTSFDLLKLIVVYPVQDQNKWMSGKGNILPDSYLLKQGSCAIDLAETIHTDFKERFLAAVDCRTGQKVGKDHELKMDDVIKIVLRPA